MIALLAFLILPRPAGANEILRGPIEAEVLRVIDGDTLEVRATIWLGQTVETRVRLAGIDAPELKSRCFLEREQANRARNRLAQLVEGGRIMLTDIRRDKYGGRVVAHVSLVHVSLVHASSREGDVAHALLRQGAVRTYTRQTRRSWCGAEARS